MAAHSCCMSKVNAVALSFCASTIIIMLAIQWRHHQVEACDYAGGSITPRNENDNDHRLFKGERRALAGGAGNGGGLGGSGGNGPPGGSVVGNTGGGTVGGAGSGLPAGNTSPGNGGGIANGGSGGGGNTGGGTVGGAGSGLPAGNTSPGNGGGIANGGSGGGGGSLGNAGGGGGGLGNAAGGTGGGSSSNSSGFGNNVGDGTPLGGGAGVGVGGQTLRVGYYDLSCPNAEAIVRAAFTGNVILADPTAPAALLRLAFHDCQVGGCDASILLDSGGSDTSELLSERNFGIRRLDFIDRIKLSLESACPGVVSCADVIVLVAREAIAITGGPRILVPTGRRDSLFSSNLMADAALPRASVDVDTFLQIFQSKGMTVAESVAILGAHTIGIGHCVNVVDRLYPSTDATLGTSFSNQLKFQCPTNLPQALNNNTVINNDLTNLIFDNQYFRDIMSGRGLFFIDAQLALDTRTSGAVAAFAGNQQLFFDIFGLAFEKLTSSNVLTGQNGQIRSNCHFTL